MGADRLRQVDLHPGEHVLWAGAPTRFPVFNRADLLMVPFSLAWSGFTIFWLAAVTRSGGSDFFLAFGWFFVLMGLHLVFGRLLVRWLALRSSTYTITNRRVVVTTSGLRGRKERSAYLRDLPPPVLSRGDVPVDTISFGGHGVLDELRAEQSMFSLIGSRSPGPYLPLLVEIDNARHVRDVLATAQSKR
ncbi:hypothetical protein [Saccharothrix deserti]|uniref:hypothetical protein n=1 Tax=Saccharothrix deserti TaxID=2593674 RepID=UPI00131E13B5|nr:hypothetical protein [Saccharothrix deserti]